jgi:hypothetical protein
MDSLSTQSPEPFSLAGYEARRSEILLHLSHFFLRYLNLIHRAFDGDLALCIVLGEISHHNTSQVFSPGELENPLIQSARSDARSWDAMPDCNALSLSMATGIPRETVRRKVAELLRRGWITRVGRRGLRITPACADHFGNGSTLEILREFVRASRRIEHLLSANEAPPAEKTPTAAPHTLTTTKQTSS